MKARLHLKEEAVPVFCRARPVPFSIRDKVAAALDEAVKQGTLEKVDSADWASPIVTVVKPSGDIRLCGDFSVAVNRHLTTEEHPFPLVEDMFAKLAGAKYFFEA